MGDIIYSSVDLGASQYSKGLAASEMCALDTIQAGKQPGKTHINITYDHCQMWIAGIVTTGPGMSNLDSS